MSRQGWPRADKPRREGPALQTRRLGKSQSDTVDTTQVPPEVPKPSFSDNLHEHEQLMSTGEPNGGLCLIYPCEERRYGQHATLGYIVTHGSTGGYEVTVITETLSQRMEQDHFFSKFRKRTQVIDPPDEWTKAAWEAWCRDNVQGVQFVLAQIRQKTRWQGAEVAA